MEVKYLWLPGSRLVVGGRKLVFKCWNLNYSILKLLLLQYWKAADERAVFSWCWQLTEIFLHGRCLHIDVPTSPESHIAIVWTGVFKGGFSLLSRQVKAKVSWIQKSTRLENRRCWEKWLLSCYAAKTPHVGTVSQLLGMSSMLGKSKKLQEVFRNK